MDESNRLGGEALVELTCVQNVESLENGIGIFADRSKSLDNGDASESCSSKSVDMKSTSLSSCPSSPKTEEGQEESMKHAGSIGTSKDKCDPLPASENTHTESGSNDVCSAEESITSSLKMIDEEVKPKSSTVDLEASEVEVKESEEVAMEVEENAPKKAHENSMIEVGSELKAAHRDPSHDPKKDSEDCSQGPNQTDKEETESKDTFEGETKFPESTEKVCDKASEKVASMDTEEVKDANEDMVVDQVASSTEEVEKNVSFEEKVDNETNKADGDIDTDTSCELMVFGQNDIKSAERVGTVLSPTCSSEEKTDKDMSPEKNSMYTQPIFEDITEDEDEDSDEENYENIELELDDLIDAGDGSKNNSSGDKGKEDDNSVEKDSSMNGDIDEKCSSHDSKFNGNEMVTTAKKESNSSDIAENSLKKEMKMEDSSASENHDPSNLHNGSDKNSSIKHSNSGGPTRKKYTARKSGKPVNQLESAPLKRINMHPIKNVTMNLSEVQDALNFDPLKNMEKKLKKSDHPVSGYSSESGQGNTYRVVSVTKSNLNLKKKRSRKNTYDFPGCKKRKKGRFSDDVLSSGASSVDSISLSDGDFGDLDTRETSALFQGTASAASNQDLAQIRNSCSSSMATTLPSSMVSPSSSPSSTTSSLSSRAANQGKGSICSSGKGSNKMKSVLEMLHERNRQKAAMEGTVGPTTSTTTTTTTTIIVSPPPNKPLVEGVKRKGTPRKRREDVIDLCESDEDEEEVFKPKAKEGKKGSEASDITTVSSSTAAKLPKSSPPVTQAPVVMMVAQHSTSPGLRSLLPRNVVVSPGKGSLGSSKAAPNTSILTSIPLVSTLPVGVKTVSMPGLPTGVTALPLTSLPPGSTIFTAVQANPGATPIAAIPGASLLNVTPPSKGSKALSTAGGSSKGHRHSKNSSVSSPSSISKKLAPTSQVNSDALRALLVGKPYALAQVSPSSAPTSPPMVFQMLTKTATNSSPAGTTLVPFPTQPVTLTSPKANPKPIVPSPVVSISSGGSLTSNKTTFSLIKPHGSSVPNGVSCLTPPKTPDTDSSSEVTVAASLSRPIAGQVDDHEVIPLCCCKISIPSFNKMLAAVTYCQALDSVDNKVLGCCNKVTNAQLVRPGVKIPFMAICESHRKRLKLHQCCPGCGHFCSQGKFQQCKKEGKSSTHLFHKQCMFYRGAKYFCPHCGEETSQCEVDLKLDADDNSSTGRVPARMAKKDLERKSVARMGQGKFKKSRSASEPSLETLTLPNKKVIDAGALPMGPDQATLARLCRCATEDRPKKYRTLPKDLFNPALEGDMEKVFYLLADGIDPNTRCEESDDQMPLHAAATSGSLGTVFILQQFGAEMHAQDRNLRTPMMCAAENGHSSIVQFLLKAGAKIEDRGEDGMTSLHYAAKAGYIDVIQLILETQKLDINVEDDGGWTPIIWATESMLDDVVRYLISQGGDPNKKDNEENTGLHWAAFSGSGEIAEMFLDMGCELDTPNEHGDRPLHIAARQDHYSIVVLLLARGADVDIKNNKDETPMDCCLNKTGQVWMALKVNHQLRGFAARKLIQPEHLLDRDITMGREKNPIACVNKEDSEPCPTDYLYINANVETTPLNINCVITSLQSCRCKDDCSSMYCVCGRSSIKSWYDKMGRLVENFNFLEPPHIFECNRACRCWVNCNNRVVQNGIICRLQLFRTNGRGWGVRTLMDIPKGTFVCEYIGELISDSEADRREDDSYLFDLDNKDGDTYCIDARKYGNIARFINHLCEPNLIPVKVFVEHQDLRFPRICFFSSRDVKAYEELGFDYGEKFWIIKWKHFTCACQSVKCKYSSETIQKTLDDYKLRFPDEPMQES